MAKREYLLESTVNGILDILKQEGEIPRLIPSELSLSKTLSVSRTSIRKAIGVLIEKGVIEENGRFKVLLRKVLKEDYFLMESQVSSSEDAIQQFFLNQVFSGNILPGDRFSVLELSKESGCSRSTVRDFLLRFSRYGLVEQLPRKMWGMVRFDDSFMRELIATRRLFETGAVTALMTRMSEEGRQALIEIQKQLLELEESPERDLNLFREIMERFYKILIGAWKNRFLEQFDQIIRFVFQFQEHWCQEEEEIQLETALQQSRELLEAILDGDQAEALARLNQHLETAEELLIEAIHGTL